MDNLPKGEPYIKMGVKGRYIYERKCLEKSDGMEIGYGLFCV